MTWFPKNTTPEDKVKFYMDTVGLSEQETMAYLTPMSQMDKDIYHIAKQAEAKYCTWVDAENAQYVLENPEKYMTRTEKMNYEAQRQEKETSETSQFSGISSEQPAF